MIFLIEEFLTEYELIQLRLLSHNSEFFILFFYIGYLTLGKIN